MSEQRHYVGVTGITSAEEAQEVIDLWYEAWAAVGRVWVHMKQPPCDLMLGTLASAKTLRGETNSKPMRYPKREDLRNCPVRTKGVVNLVHYAGDFKYDGDVQQLLAEEQELLELARWAGSAWDGVQFNGRWPSPGALDHFLRKDISAWVGRRVVLQVRLGELQDQLARAVAPYNGLVTDVLVDASCGAGAVMTAEQRVEVVEHFAKLHLLRTQRGFGDMRLGVAGGLSGENLRGDFVANEHGKISWARLLQLDTSIDAEGRLRDDEPGGGRLDLKAVRAYFNAVVTLYTEKA